MNELVTKAKFQAASKGAKAAPRTCGAKPCVPSHFSFSFLLLFRFLNTRYQFGKWRKQRGAWCKAARRMVQNLTQNLVRLSGNESATTEHCSKFNFVCVFLRNRSSSNAMHWMACT
jgi:hypothetical protein